MSVNTKSRAEQSLLTTYSPKRIQTPPPSAVHAWYTRLCTAEAAEAQVERGCPQLTLLATRRRHIVGKSRNMSADMLFTPELLALMPPTICCVRSQSVRDLVTEISGGATPAPVRCGSELSSSELATQARPSQPHSRLMMPVHVVSRLASIAAHIHTHPWADFGPYLVGERLTTRTVQ